MKILALLSILISSFAVSFADISGHWTGRIMDQFDVAYDFKQEGEKLTGTTTGPEGEAVQITDGTVIGDDVAFTINIMGGPVPIKGKLVEKTLKLSFNIQGNDIALDLMKAEK